MCREPVTQIRPAGAPPSPLSDQAWSSREAAFNRSRENGAFPHPIIIGAGLLGLDVAAAARQSIRSGDSSLVTTPISVQSMPWSCATPVQMSFRDEASMERAVPPAILASVSSTMSGLLPERSCAANARCSLSLAIPMMRARGPSGSTVLITSDKAFADASVWAPSIRMVDDLSSPRTEASSCVRNWLLPSN